MTDTIEKDLLERIARWDGKDATERDQIRARLYCWQKGYGFDSIMGSVLNGVDHRKVFFMDNPADQFSGSTIDMTALPVWPASPTGKRSLWQRLRFVP